MLDTTRGAVPVAMLDTNCPVVVKLPPDTLPVAVIKPVVPKLPTLALPVTVTDVSDPTEVTFG